jgi:adenylosuccinate lyase
MRKYGHENPYEILKDMTRGKSVVHKEDLQNLIKGLKLPEDQKLTLLELTPHSYIGNAHKMANVKKYL